MSSYKDVTPSSALAKRNSDYIRRQLAKRLGVEQESLAKELSLRTGLPYQTVKNFVRGHDYSGRVFSSVYGILEAYPRSVKKSLAIDYIVKMLPKADREEIMNLFMDSTWNPNSE